jgi:hypothetical protein
MRELMMERFLDAIIIEDPRGRRLGVIADSAEVLEGRFSEA